MPPPYVPIPANANLMIRLLNDIARLNGSLIDIPENSPLIIVLLREIQIEILALAAGAGTQQPSDWTASSGVTRILNKPTLGSAAAADTDDFDAAGSATAAYNAAITALSSAIAALDFLSTANNGLHEDPNGNVKLGGVLVENTTITSALGKLLSIVSTDSIALNLSTTGSSQAALNASSQSGVAALLNSSTYSALQASSDGGVYSARFQSYLAASNDAVVQGILIRAINGAAPSANGFGVSIDFQLMTTNLGTSDISNQIISKWLDAVHATRTSELIIKGLLAGASHELLSLVGTGQLKLLKYGVGSFVASPTYLLGIGSTGNTVEVPLTSFVSQSGYNYFVVQTVNTGVPATDALTNGLRLIAGYNAAKALNIGTKSVDNRACVLLMPGDYDLDDQTLYLDTSFVDIIGINTNPLDTIVRCSNNSGAVISFGDAVDAMLSNFDLRNDDANDGFGIGGDSNSFVRGYNLNFSGFKPFSLDGFTDLNCIFEKITFNETGDLFYCDGVLTGTFRDIKGTTCSNFISSNGRLDIIVENIEVTNNCGFAFVCNAEEEGRIIAKINNAKFKNVTEIIKTASGGISGTFNNITVTGNGLDSAFCADGSYDEENITGTFTNITISNIITRLFTCTLNLNVVVDNLKLTSNTIASTSNFAFVSSSGSINGKYSNIDLGTTNFYGIFVAAVNIDGVFRSINFRNAGRNIFYGDIVTGFFESLTFTHYSYDVDSKSKLFNAISELNGSFTDIIIGCATNAFLSEGTMQGTFKNLVIKEIEEDFFIQAVGNNYRECYLYDCRIYGAFLAPSFNAKIFNSIIDARGLTIDGIADIATGAIIERCKVLADGGSVSINSIDTPSVQITFTLTNRSIAPSITVPTVNYNINDSTII